MMQRAMQLAKCGANQGEVPVGAVLTAGGRIIGEGFNCPISTSDPTAHAEIIAIRQACKGLDNYRLPADSTLYVTLEPCTMCFGVLVHSRVSRVVFGACEPKAGVMISQLNLSQMPFYNHALTVSEGLLACECSAMMSEFFKQRRAHKKAQKQANKAQNGGCQ
ncbi:tRNA adenosine(34) deaminase TadA [Moraxella caviae]|nr:tRNA adenosine(34) deaminase TadA [Moraxella caviae]OOR87266.1 tRNA adenosine(34) deaminase TadA [Moraxella caviae]